MRFLFLAVHAPDRAPSQRFRFEQYLTSLRRRGIECDFSWLLDADGASLLYSTGNVVRKALLTMRSLATRTLQLPSLRRYDLVFVQREALFIGGPFIERTAKALGARLVLDFDDSIWLNETSEFNRRFALLKSAKKVPRLVAMADLVFAGNAYLAEYARRFNDRVTIVPTTIDTDRYVPRVEPRSDDEPICVGWSGSFSTIAHLRLALPILRRLKQRFGARIRFKVIGDSSFRDDELGIVGMPWRLESELHDLCDIDIGLMPLPDNEWTRGKCGLKGLQYMALGVPTLMSPVGVNVEIIQHGQNGFLPRTEDEWTDTISRLIEDPGLRARIGAAGRRRVECHYSVRAWRDQYYDLLTGLTGNPRAGI
jgi:glycosyltransferase involved in cell wall biosynthesis